MSMMMAHLAFPRQGDDLVHVFADQHVAAAFARQRPS